MANKIRIVLGIILLLLGLILLYASFENFYYPIKHNNLKNLGTNAIIQMFIVLLISILFIIFSILTFINKKYIIMPSIILLGLLLIYSIIYTIIGFNMFNDPSICGISLPCSYWNKLLLYQTIQLIVYIILSIIGLVLAFKVHKKHKR